MQWRMILGGIVAVSCMLCGKTLAWTSGRRYRLIVELTDGLRMLKIQILQRMAPLEQALQATGAAPFQRMAERLAHSEDARQAWAEFCREHRRRGGLLDCLEDRELRTLERLFDQIGQSGRAEQGEIIRACIAELESAQEESRAHAMRAAGLYPAIGLLAGAGLAVLML